MTSTFGINGPTFNDTSAPADQPLATTLYLDWLYYKQNPQLQQFIAQNYSQYAWMMDNPELAPIVVSTALHGWDAAHVAAALNQTSWWKSNGANVAQWQNLQATDPATAAQRVSDMKNTILEDANRLGVALNDQQMTDLATKANEFAWDSTTIQRNVANMVTQGSSPGTYAFAPTGQAAQFQAQLASILQQYAVPVSQATKDWWTSLAVQGKGDINGVENYLRQQAAQLYPWMASGIAQGIKPADQLHPYASVAANLLGVSESAIDWTDPKWSSALTSRATDGTIAPVSQQQFAVTLRTDPTFGYSKTPTAIANAYSTARQLAETMGAVKI